MTRKARNEITMEATLCTSGPRGWALVAIACIGLTISKFGQSIANFACGRMIKITHLPKSKKRK